MFQQVNSVNLVYVGQQHIIITMIFIIRSVEREQRKEIALQFWTQYF